MMQNGTYVLPVRRVYDTKGDLGAADVQMEAEASPGQTPSSGSGEPPDASVSQRASQKDSSGVSGESGGPIQAQGSKDPCEGLGDRDLADPRENKIMILYVMIVPGTSL